MRQHIRLGRILGVQIGLHISWLVIASLIVLMLAGQFRFNHPEWDASTIWISALITALLFFVTLVAHELSHSAVAISRGLPVRSITLFALGGVANLEKDSEDAKSEFWIAIAGPIMSTAIGLTLLLAASALGWQPGSAPATPVLAVTVWLGYINLVLAVFNMIPGFPLDGGRVLRAVVWWITGNATRAMRIATLTGRMVAVGFMAWGFFGFLTGFGFGGLWIALIGWFLYQAASASYAQMRITEALRGVLVGDLMARDYPTVPCSTNLQDFIRDQVLPSGRRCFLVTAEDKTIGLITAVDIRNVSESERPFKTVCDVMRPMAQVQTIAPEAPVWEALERMGRQQVAQLPVASNGHVEGIISRFAVMNYIEMRREIGNTQPPLARAA